MCTGFKGFYLFMCVLQLGDGIRLLTLSDDDLDIGSDHKPNILLIGGLNSKESVGRNLLIRLARHIVKG